MLIKAEQAKEAGWVGLEALHISIASAADELTVIWNKSHLKQNCQRRETVTYMLILPIFTTRKSEHCLPQHSAVPLDNAYLERNKIKFGVDYCFI